MGKVLSALTLAALCSQPTLASAGCYSVYDRNNQLIFQNTQSPVDLQQPITESIKKRFSADARMVFTPKSDECAPVDLAEAKTKVAESQDKSK